MSPDGVPPAVAHRRPLLDVVFVDLDPEPRPVGDLHVAIGVVEDLWVLDVVEEVVALVVVDAEALLLDEGVVAVGVDLEIHRQRDRPERAVQGDGHVVCLGHVRDFSRFGDSAGVRGVGLEDVDIALLQNSLEIPPRIEPLAEGDRDVGEAGELLERIGMLAQDRLLDEHQPVRFEFLEEHLGHRLVHAAMKIDADAEVRAHRLADGGDVGEHTVDLLERIDVLKFLGGVHLDRGESPRGPFLGLRGGLPWPIAADPGIDPNLVADLSAQEVIDRHTE